MAYSSGGVIAATDYNGLASTNSSNVAYVWGVGSGPFGYGQSTTQIAAVSSTATITAVQWQGLFNCINRVLGHQAGAASQLAGGGNINVAGETITYFSNVASAVTTIVTNKANFNSVRGTSTASANFDNAWASTTPTTFSQTRTVTFASADQMRYFFNAGGRINLQLTTVSGTDVTKEQSWTNMLNNGVGTVSLDYDTSTRSGSGYTLTTNGFANGFWDLTTVDTTLFRLTDTTTAYNTNYVEVLAKVTGTAGSNGGKGTIITFTINYNDQAADSVYDAPAQNTATAADQISMTMRNVITVIRPETTYLTDVWGTITPA